MRVRAESTQRKRIGNQELVFSRVPRVDIRIGQVRYFQPQSSTIIHLVSQSQFQPEEKRAAHIFTVTLTIAANGRFRRKYPARRQCDVGIKAPITIDAAIGIGQ